MKTAKLGRTRSILLNTTITTAVLVLTAACACAEAIPPQVLHNFSTGWGPLAPLVQAPDGNFYGTTQSGGSTGRGIVFKMTPDGAVTTLVNFTGPNGQSPSMVPLIADDYGNLYGSTEHGGTGDRGIVFKVTLAGVLTPLVQFNGVNGAAPRGLVMDNSGNLYGTTVTSVLEAGSIFKIAADGTFSTLFNFSTGSPPGMLIVGRDVTFMEEPITVPAATAWYIASPWTERLLPWRDCRAAQAPTQHFSRKARTGTCTERRSMAEQAASGLLFESAPMVY